MPPPFKLIVHLGTTAISAVMYGSIIRFGVKKHVQQSTIRRAVYPTNVFSSGSIQPNRKDKNLIDDIRESASGLPPVSSSSTGGDDRVNVVKTSTSLSSSISDEVQNSGNMGSYVADTAKQGVAKAMETGLDIGEMAKKTLDNVWDATKDTTNKMKEAVAGDREEGNDVPPTERFVDYLRKRAGDNDLRK